MTTILEKLNQVQTLITESLSLINVTPSPQPTNWPISIRPLANEAGYIEGAYMQTVGSEIVCLYRQGVNHAGNGGKLALRRSSDNGATWSSPTILQAITNRDCRNQVLGKTMTGRLIAFNRSSDYVTTEKLWKHISDDGGLTWTTSEFNNISLAYVPFGSMVETSNGLMQTFYAGNSIIGMFSNDNGDTWEQATIFHAGWTSATLTEPQAIAIDLSRIVVVCRDNKHAGRYWHIKSSDGGLTWSTPARALFSSTATGLGAPVDMCLHNGQVYFMWDSRNFWKQYLKILPAEDFWANPALGWQAGNNPQIVYTSKIASGNATGAEYGYPNMISLPQGVLSAFYDSKTGNGTTETEILVRSL